jgi:hypothetical protein
MARPRVVDGEDGLQIRRAAANMLNNKSWSAEKGWSSSLEVGHGANTSSLEKNNLVMKDHKKPRTWMNSLDKQSKRKKMDMRFDTRKVRRGQVSSEQCRKKSQNIS